MTKDRSITVRLDQLLDRKLKQLALQRRRSRGDLIRILIEEADGELSPDGQRVLEVQAQQFSVARRAQRSEKATV